MEIEEDGLMFEKAFDTESLSSFNCGVISSLLLTDNSF